MRFSTAFAVATVGSLVTALTYNGVDISSLLVVEGNGITYKSSSGTVTPLETLLKNVGGVNIVRQRVWVNPSGGTYNLDYNVRLAKRVKAAGMSTYIDLHYSDTWADPAHQAKPAAWTSYDLGNLAWAAYNHSKSVCDTFQTNGLPISLISIGNEITAGMLFSTGSTSNFNNLATILHSAAWGIKDSTLTTKPKIMIHLDNGWNWETQKWWYDGVLAAGPFLATDYDVQGVSFYPFYGTGATLAALKSSLTNMRSRYGKEVMVVETDWPATSCSVTFPSDLSSIPKTPAGQTTFMNNLRSTISSAGGTGLFYWEPAWIGNANLGSSCGDNLMVDSSGNIRSSFSALGVGGSTGGTTTTTTTSRTSSTTSSSRSSTTVSTSRTSTTSTTTGGSTPCAAKYGQCGGSGFTGPTCCVSGSTCTYSNDWYSQCL